MTPQLWIGFGFAAACLLILAITIFKRDLVNQSNYPQVKFVCALCAAMSGGFITGDALFHGNWKTASGGEIALTGAAGFALFFVVWFFYPPPPKDPVAIPGVEFDIPPNATFRQTLDSAAQLSGGVSLDYQEFKPAELSAKMVAGHVSSVTLIEMFTNLRLRTQRPGAVREYKVTKSNNVYRFKV